MLKADASISKTERIKHIEKSLTTLDKSNASELTIESRDIERIEKFRCRSLSKSLTLKCLREEIEKRCKLKKLEVQETCFVISDVILTNNLNEELFLSKDEQFALALKSENFEHDKFEAIRKKQALLATELLLTTKNQCDEQDFKCLSQNIESFCLDHSDIKGLPWQACVGAIVSYIGRVRN